MNLTAFHTFLICVTVATYVLGAWTLLRLRDDLFAVFLSALFIYTIFSQITYVFFPELLEAIGCYFGPEAFFPYWRLVWLSFCAIVAASVIRVRFFREIYIFKAGWFKVASPSSSLFLFHGLFGLFLIGLLSTVIANFDEINYARIKSPELIYFIFRQPTAIVVLYAKARFYYSGKVDRILSTIWLLAISLTFIIVAARAGQRLVVWCTFVGIATLELIPFTQDWRRKVKIVIFMAVSGLAFIRFSNVVVEARAAEQIDVAQFFAAFFSPGGASTIDSGQASEDGLRRFVWNDYTVPSAVLFFMQRFDITEPLEVVRSNFYNSLLFMEYPQLSERISAMLTSAANRNEGYAYYILNEGFHALGHLGFIYNAIVISAGFWLWSRLAKSGDQRMDRVMAAAMAVAFLGMVRAPSFYFFKDLYLTYLPCFLLVGLGIRACDTRFVPLSRKSVNIREARR